MGLQHRDFGHRGRDWTFSNASVTPVTSVPLIGKVYSIEMFSNGSFNETNELSDADIEAFNNHDKEDSITNYSGYLKTRRISNLKAFIKAGYEDEDEDSRTVPYDWRQTIYAPAEVLFIDQAIRGLENDTYNNTKTKGGEIFEYNWGACTAKFEPISKSTATGDIDKGYRMTYTKQRVPFPSKFERPVRVQK